MGLFKYAGGEGYLRVSFRGIARRHDAFLCCPGPSLSMQDLNLSELSFPGSQVWAVNTAYPRVRPDVWVGMDPPSCYDSKLWWEPFVKVVGSKYIESRCGDVPIRTCPNVFFMPGAAMKLSEIFGHLGDDADFIWPEKSGYPNTFFSALHLAVWFGARRIYLLGCDFGGLSDYHDGRVLDEAKRARNRQLYDYILAQLPAFRKAAEARGVSLISCTPNSPANDVLDYWMVGEAVQAARGHVERRIFDRVLDGADAELCEWLPRPREGCGVITGCDAAQEWMLPWWYENFRKHNDGLSVAFYDFGMSEAGRKWCERQGEVYPVGAETKAIENTFFRRPFCLLRSPFEKTFLVDPDCEVLGDLSGVFDFISSRGVFVTEDPYNPWSKEFRVPALATGVVGACRGEPVISEWARAILTMPEKFRSDQEAFNFVVSRREERVFILPREYQWLRLDKEENPNALLIHWTGPAGKEVIRRKMAEPSMPRSNVWVAFPSARPEVGAATCLKWKNRGYRTAMAVDPNFPLGLEFKGVDLLHRLTEWHGVAAAHNELAHGILNRNDEAKVVVFCGDDTYPDERFAAPDLAAQFLEHFPDTFGVMQPTGDRYGNYDGACISPWVGRAFMERMYDGKGPWCDQYYHIFTDCEMYDVAESLGVLWKRPDLVQYHDHWTRRGLQRPEYLIPSGQHYEADKALYASRKAQGFPGATAGAEGKSFVCPQADSCSAGTEMCGGVDNGTCVLQAVGERDEAMTARKASD